MKISALFASTALLTSGISAHGGVRSYNIAGKQYEGWPIYGGNQQTIQRSWKSIDPLTNVGSNTLRCNDAGGVAALSATVAAGQSIKAEWRSWPHTHGPVIVWMAKCPGKCANFDGSGKVWFKIDQSGLLGGTLKDENWGMDKMIAQGFSWTTTIPSSFSPGEYLIRHELIAIHSPGAPQFYPQCAHLTVTGSGKSVPSSNYLASIPGVYSLSDPSLAVNIYGPDGAKTSWVIPGPAVFRA